jgi:hypothetical protein
MQGAEVVMVFHPGNAVGPFPVRLHVDASVIEFNFAFFNQGD